MCIMSSIGLIFDGGCVDGDSSGSFLWCFIDLSVFYVLGSLFVGKEFSDGGCESCFSVINVSNCTHYVMIVVPLT